MNEQDRVIEESNPEDELMDNCETVVRAGIWLLRNGYGKLQLLPYASPSGCYWRCEFHPTGYPNLPFYRYSTGSGYKYLQDHCGGRIHKTVTPATLAKAIMVSVPGEMKALCEGPVTRETEQWIAEMERALSGNQVPQAFHEYTDDYSKWQLVTIGGGGSLIAPQPGYIPPGEVTHWSKTPFWRDAVAHAEHLSKLPEFPLSIADEEATCQIGVELAAALRGADRNETGRLLRSAIAALSLLAQESHELQGRN